MKTTSAKEKRGIHTMESAKTSIKTDNIRPDVKLESQVSEPCTNKSVVPEFILPEGCNIIPTAMAEEMRLKMQDVGVIKVRNVLTASECNDIHRDIAQKYSAISEAFIEDINAGIQVLPTRQHGCYTEKGATVTDRRDLAPNTLVKPALAIGQSPMVWMARERSSKVFAALWNTPNLLTSVDTVAYSDDVTKSSSGKGIRELHMDCAPDERGLNFYQGALYVKSSPSSRTHWCTSVVPRAHEIHDKIMDNSIGKGGKTYPGSVTLESKKYSDLLKAYREETVQIEEPGTILVWDSRIPHRSHSPKDKSSRSQRCIVFVSMTPRAKATRADMNNYGKVMKRRTCTGHRTGGKYMRVLRKPNQKSKVARVMQDILPNLDTLSEQQKKLCGQ